MRTVAAEVAADCRRFSRDLREAVSVIPNFFERQRLHVATGCWLAPAHIRTRENADCDGGHVRRTAAEGHIEAHHPAPHQR